jgi:hypothetical protein
VSESALEMAIEILGDAYHRNVFADQIDPELRKLLEEKYKNTTPNYTNIAMTMYKWELDNPTKKIFKKDEGLSMKDDGYGKTIE